MKFSYFHRLWCTSEGYFACSFYFCILEEIVTLLDDVINLSFNVNCSSLIFVKIPPLVPGYFLVRDSSPRWIFSPGRPVCVAIDDIDKVVSSNKKLCTNVHHCTLHHTPLLSLNGEKEIGGIVGEFRKMFTTPLTIK